MTAAGYVTFFALVPHDPLASLLPEQIYNSSLMSLFYLIAFPGLLILLLYRLKRRILN